MCPHCLGLNELRLPAGEFSFEQYRTNPEESSDSKPSTVTVINFGGEDD